MSKIKLYNVVAHTERGADLLIVANEKHQTGEMGTPLRCLTKKLSKSFPAKIDGRGNEMPL